MRERVHFNMHLRLFFEAGGCTNNKPKVILIIRIALSNRSRVLQEAPGDQCIVGMRQDLKMRVKKTIELKVQDRLKD